MKCSSLHLNFKLLVHKLLGVWIWWCGVVRGDWNNVFKEFARILSKLSKLNIILGLPNRFQSVILSNSVMHGETFTHRGLKYHCFHFCKNLIVWSLSLSVSCPWEKVCDCLTCKLHLSDYFTSIYQGYYMYHGEKKKILHKQANITAFKFLLHGCWSSLKLHPSWIYNFCSIQLGLILFSEAMIQTLFSVNCAEIEYLTCFDVLLYYWVTE